MNRWLAHQPACGGVRIGVCVCVCVRMCVCECVCLYECEISLNIWMIPCPVYLVVHATPGGCVCAFVCFAYVWWLQVCCCWGVSIFVNGLHGCANVRWGASVFFAGVSVCECAFVFTWVHVCGFVQITFIGVPTWIFPGRLAPRLAASQCITLKCIYFY